MVAMAIADSLGHQFEFIPVQEKPDPKDFSMPYYTPPSPDHPTGSFRHAQNSFRLKIGQWTDDTSMGLCMCDSLLSCGGYSAWNVRVWFWNWWNNGVDNAFRLDHERIESMKAWGGRMSLSVGLGGNIAKSISEVSQYEERGEERGSEGAGAGRKRKRPPPHCTLPTQDAGNGSLMRLTPIPIYFHSSLPLATRYSVDSSFTTHPGPLAAEACAFLGYLIARCIHRMGKEEEYTTAEFLDVVRGEFLGQLNEEVTSAAHDDVTISAKKAMVRLLRSEEPDESKERCWNWRHADLGIWRTLANRGKLYNGYPVSPGYFGSFSMDGLAIALHCVYHTDNFAECICRVVNMCGDADSTGAICGQIAGAFYSVGDVTPSWRSAVREWDGGEIELRAVLLYFAGEIDRLTNPTWPLSDGPIGECESEAIDARGRGGEGKLDERKRVGRVGEEGRGTEMSSEVPFRRGAWVMLAVLAVALLSWWMGGK